MTNKEEMSELMMKLTFNVMDYVRNNRRSCEGIRQRDVLIFQTIYQSKDHQIKVSDLAKKMQVSNAAVSQMIAKYEGKGWLRRVHSNVDRRTVFVQIEPDFLTQIQEKGKAHKKALNDYLEYLGDDDIEHLYRILNKTFVYLEKAHD